MTKKMINPYPKEQKEAILARMMPPNNESVRKISKETGISEATLYVWKKEARLTGYAVPSDSMTSDKWSSEDKFPFFRMLAVIFLFLLTTTFQQFY